MVDISITKCRSNGVGRDLGDKQKNLVAASQKRGRFDFCRSLFMRDKHESKEMVVRYLWLRGGCIIKKEAIV